MRQAVLAALPRPPQIDQTTALGRADDGEKLKGILAAGLLPQVQIKPAPEPEPPVSPREFPTWKTIKIRVHKDVAALHKSLEKANC